MRTWQIRSTSDLGRAIAGARELRGLTQQELADDLGVDRTYLARLESKADALILERSLRALRRLGATVTIEMDDVDG